MAKLLLGLTALSVLGGGYPRPLFPGAPRALFAPDGGAGGGDIDLKTLESSVKELGLNVKQTTDKLKESAEKYLQEVKVYGQASADAKKTADEALIAANKSATTLQQLEQAVNRLRESGLGGESALKTVGQHVTDSDDFKKFVANGGKGKYRQVITSLTTDAAGSAGAGVPKDVKSGIQRLAVETPRIRDLLMPGRTSSNTVEYVKEKVWTNNAAIQTSEGALKGESNLQLELATATVRTIAHFVKASTQILDDAPGLRSLIDFRLRWGLDIVEDRQLLNGTGAGVQLSGLIQNSTAYSDPFSVEAESSIDVLRKAMLQATLAEWPATGIVLHPQDWARIQLTKDAEERYLFANPQQGATSTLWGLPIVETQAMGITKFLVGAFTPAAQIFDRQETVIELSTEDDTNFTHNLVTIRAEKRLTLAVYRDEALIYGDMGEMS
jgi:HK97 family phage major capsid protein